MLSRNHAIEKPLTPTLSPFYGERVGVRGVADSTASFRLSRNDTLAGGRAGCLSPPLRGTRGTNAVIGRSLFRAFTLDKTLVMIATSRRAEGSAPYRKMRKPTASFRLRSYPQNPVVAGLPTAPPRPTAGRPAEFRRGQETGTERFGIGSMSAPANKPDLESFTKELRELGSRYNFKLMSFGGMASQTRGTDTMFLAVWSSLPPAHSFRPLLPPSSQLNSPQKLSPVHPPARGIYAQIG
jgi:hypothetical protein